MALPVYILASVWLMPSLQCKLQLLKISAHLMKISFLSHLPSILLALALTFSFNVPLHGASESISKEQAVSIAQQAYPGRVLAVRREGAVYRVKTLNDSGEVRIILVDAYSGKVISGP